MTYRFGAYEFDAAANLLRKNGRAMPLEPQPARALALLLSRADEVVSKEDLRQAIWGGDTHVDFDRGLAYCLSQVRTALGDSGDNPRFVQTLPRRGYRFVAPIHRNDGAVPVALPSTSSSPPNGRRVAAAVAAGLVIAAATYIWTLGQSSNASPSRQVVAVSIFDNETGSRSTTVWCPAFPISSSRA